MHRPFHTVLVALLLAQSASAQRIDPQPVPDLSAFTLGQPAEAFGAKGSAGRATSLEVKTMSVGYEVSYHSSDIEVDGAGNLHAVYMVYAGANGASDVYYAFCPVSRLAACDNPQTWQRVKIGADTPFLQLELTPGGQPRVLLYDEDIDVIVAGATHYFYAECDAGCLSAAAWRSTKLWDTTNGGILHAQDFSPHTFALDAQGRPRFIYFAGHDYDTNTDPYYFTGCDADCTTPANWWKRRMPAQTYHATADDFERSTLVLTRAGQPRILTTAFSGGDSWLSYIACEGACTSDSDWKFSEMLVKLVADGYCGGSPVDCYWSMDLDAQDRPRIVAAAQSSSLFYGWCDGDCLKQASWDGSRLTIDNAKSSYPFLKLDATGHPRIAVQGWGSGMQGLAYVWCTSDCESTSTYDGWNAEVVDFAARIQTDFTIPPPSGCQVGDWITGFRPSLALDRNGNPRLMHDGEYLVPCYSGYPNPSFSYESRWWTSSVVFLQQPGGSPTPVEREPAAQRFAFEVAGANPFVDETAFRLLLPEAEAVRLVVYDAQGRVAAEAFHASLPAGEHALRFNGEALAGGVYFARLTAGTHAETRQIVRVR